MSLLTQFTGDECRQQNQINPQNEQWNGTRLRLINLPRIQQPQRSIVTDPVPDLQPSNPIRQIEIQIQDLQQKLQQPQRQTQAEQQPQRQPQRQTQQQQQPQRQTQQQQQPQRQTQAEQQPQRQTQQQQQPQRQTQPQRQLQPQRQQTQQQQFQPQTQSQTQPQQFRQPQTQTQTQQQEQRRSQPQQQQDSTPNRSSQAPVRVPIPRLPNVGIPKQPTQLPQGNSQRVPQSSRNASEELIKQQNKQRFGNAIEEAERVRLQKINGKGSVPVRQGYQMGGAGC